VRRFADAGGWTSPRIAEAFGVREDTVRLWRGDFANGGVDALKASVAPGPASVKSETALRVVSPLLDAPVANRPNSSTLTKTDPLVLMETDLASAHGLVVNWPAQATAGTLSGNYSFLRSQGTFVIPARWPKDYGATVTDGVYFAVRSGGLAADGAAGSGLRNDGPSMRTVMQ
jgi:hypothetical protein